MNSAIAWFARNGVAANLLMFTIIGIGVHALFFRIPLEVFPDIALDEIRVSIPFRGATPEDVEEGVVQRVEEAIHDLEGIKELVTEAREGSASIRIELDNGVDPRELLDDVKNRIDAISTFPAETERPTYRVASRTREVISVVVAGDIGERELRILGERVRDDLTAIPGITQVELEAVRPYEISIEISENVLHQHGLTFNDIAAAIRAGSLDLSGGSIRTAGGEILLRTKAQAYDADDFEAIVVLTRRDGTRLTLGELATVSDGFDENRLEARFDGKPAVMIEVYRVGDQNAITVADAVKGYVAGLGPTLPPGAEVSYWRDRSRIVKKRLKTLVDSAWQGGLLIFILLALFLRFSVAVWVCVGIPLSFAGALALMPYLGVTINVISLFAFILVLGVVVDDAIVTGENIYTHLRRGTPPEEAVIIGTQEVAVPVTFGILTTVAAFVPLLLVEGFRGKLFAQIPTIVIPVLLFSLVESKLILPAHLRHVDPRRPAGPLVRLQQRVATGLELAIDRIYRPILGAALAYRYLTLSLFVGVFIVVVALAGSGRVSFIFFPRVQSEVARATLVMPPGTPFESTRRFVARMTAAAERLKAEHIQPENGESIIKSILATTGTTGGSGAGVSYVGRVMFEIVAPEDRTSTTTSAELVRAWRRAIGPIPGAESVTFRAEIGRSRSPIDVQLAGRDFAALSAMAAEFKARLQTYPGVFDVGDSFESGKEEVRLALRPEAELLGIDTAELARQVRQAFFGEEAQRLQRGRDDVRVMVRYPGEERRSLESLESMHIRTVEGVEVPFSEVATASLGRGFSVIRRIDRKRVVNVTADVNKETADVEAIKADLASFGEALAARYPGVASSLEGEAREQRESFRSLGVGLAFVLFVVYALLAIPFRSYVQPFIVMSVIPFGVVGAILGHMVMGMTLSIMSMMGMLALIGVVVNDSLVLVDYVNRHRRAGQDAAEAAQQAGAARFRAVLLTSLTTFAGLTPLLLDKSTQAQFLIPMAVSLGFGILFATVITLVLVPINYLVLDDLRRVLGFSAPAPRVPAAETPVQ